MYASVNHGIILPLNPTHHNIETSDTWLDIIATSSTNNVLDYGQLPAPGFSRHDLLFLSFKLNLPKQKPAVVFMRSYSSLNIDTLTKDASCLDWSPVLCASTVDDKVHSLNNIV